MAFPPDERVLVCGRIGDPYCTPSPGSVKKVCCDCGSEVMASPDSVDENNRLGTPIVCIQCFARHRDEGNIVIWVRQEVKRPEQ